MDEWVMERYELARERIGEILEEKTVAEPYRDFFIKEAAFLKTVAAVMDHEQEREAWSLGEHQKLNHELYEDVLPENYENSYGNPAYAQKMLENTEGILPSFIQNFMARSPMHLRKRSGILR